MGDPEEAGVGTLTTTCAVFCSLGGSVTVSCGMLVWVMNGVDRGRGGIGGTWVVTPVNNHKLDNDMLLFIFKVSANK